MNYFKKTNEMVNVKVQEGWKIIFVGEVKRVQKTDIDKSGRNTKYIVQIQMTVDSIDDAAEIKLTSPILCQGRETEIISYLRRLPQVGEILEIQSYGIDERPQLLSINGAKFVNLK